MDYLIGILHKLIGWIGFGMIFLGIIGLFLDGKPSNILMALGFGSIILLLLEIKGIMIVSQLKQQAAKKGGL